MYILDKPQLIVKHEQPINSTTKKKFVHVIKAVMDLLNLHKDTHLFTLYFICLICLNVHVGIIILIKPREERKGKNK